MAEQGDGATLTFNQVALMNFKNLGEMAREGISAEMEDLLDIMWYSIPQRFRGPKEEDWNKIEEMRGSGDDDYKKRKRIMNKQGIITAVYDLAGVFFKSTDPQLRTWKYKSSFGKTKEKAGDAEFE